MYLNVHCPSFKVKEFSLSMRTSGNISTAARPQALWHWMDFSTLGKVEVVTAGKRSTVPGPRPMCILVDWWNNSKDYEKISNLIGSPAPNLHSVILCGVEISPKKLAKKLKQKNIEATLYDANVNTFHIDMPPSLYPMSAREDQLPGLKKWLTGTGGMLVTHNLLFSGMEASEIVLVSMNIACEPNLRSGLLRAVGKLTIITSKDGVKQKELKEHFDIIDQYSLKWKH